MNTSLALRSALLAAVLALGACSGSGESASAEIQESTTTTVASTTTPTTEPEREVGTFPVDIDGVVIAAEPERVVSLSPSATEMLFAIGAGDQVVAADSFSNFPPEAPTQDGLEAFTPNIEAIAAFEPDLLITSFDPENALVTAFGALDVPVLVQPGALSVDDTYAQIADLGLATGRVDEAARVNADIRDRIDAAIAAGSQSRDEPVRVYHELDDTYFSVSSASFIGDLYSRLGFENVADPADPDGFGFPQLTAEYLIEADPTVIVITDQVGYRVEDVATRPGWDSMTAVQTGNIVQIDADVASRWGPRVADLAEQLSQLTLPVATG
ncbi:MAG: ABC transporter substrate-binding protein [Acidimicrobiia bacterium]|nr:ABC transporter substrate-binding protein [Acidimicrobiia bacterium]